MRRAQAESEAVRTKAEAERLRLLAESEGERAVIDAENSRSESADAPGAGAVPARQLPEIVSQMMKPVEKIDSIRIHQVSGLGGSAGQRQAPMAAPGASRRSTR